MRLSELLIPKRPSISLEIFPPKTPEAKARLERALPRLLQAAPAFLNITYGAGGSSREQTLNLVKELAGLGQTEVVPHISGVSHSKEEVAQVLEEYLKAGIENLLIIRGDPPKDSPKAPFSGDFPHAIELVKFIKSRAPGLCLGVAGFPEGHPESSSQKEELEHLKAKIDAGAEFIITQLFFDNRHFFEYVETLEAFGIRVPVVAGVLIVTSPRQLGVIPEIAKGTRIPGELLEAFNKARTPEECLETGVEWAGKQIEEILHSKAPWVHLYTMNQSRPLKRLMERLNLKRLIDIPQEQAAVRMPQK